jgi:anaerobic magnesium-protoporphyrin IX monomethyl ester cyclase
VDEVRAATRELKAHGIRACWFLQLGYPSESWADLISTRDLVREEEPDDIGVSVAYPLPGTPFYDRVRADLGLKQNWSDSGELAMMFHGTYSTAFYGRVRDALHDEVRNRERVDTPWAALLRDEPQHRSPAPLSSATKAG